MSSSCVTAELGVKITYNLNDSPQLRLARHQPLKATIYLPDDPSSSSSSSAAAPSKSKNYDGCFAELPLGVCLSALKDASPELITNPSFDYSVYVNDPTESTSSSDASVLVGKGLLSSCLKEISKPASPSTVFGKVVKDGIRGQSILVHFVLEKTPRIAQDPPATPQPPLATPLAPQHPAAAHSDPSINALLSMLSATNLPPIAPSTAVPDVSQLFSALAGCYGLASWPNIPHAAAPKPSEVIVIKEEEDVEACVPPLQPTTAAAAAPVTRVRRPSLDKENVPPAASTTKGHPRTSMPSASTSTGHTHAKASLTKSKSTSALPLPGCDPNTVVASRNMMPFLQVPPLQPLAPMSLFPTDDGVAPPVIASQPPPRPSSPLHLTIPTAMSTSMPAPQQPQSDFVPPSSDPAGPMPMTPSEGALAPARGKKRKAGKNLGPNGNGWYRRTDLPPMTSSDFVIPQQASSSSFLQTVVASSSAVKTKARSKKRASEGGGENEGSAKKRAKKSKDVKNMPQVVVAAASSPDVGMAVEETTAVAAGPSRVMGLAATSPIKPTKGFSGIKKITLRTGKATPKAPTPPAPVSSPPPTLPVLASASTPVLVPAALPSPSGSVTPTAKDRGQPVTHIRTLNFLSLSVPPKPSTTASPTSMTEMVDPPVKSASVPPSANPIETSVARSVSLQPSPAAAAAAADSGISSVVQTLAVPEASDPVPSRPVTPTPPATTAATPMPVCPRTPTRRTVPLHNDGDVVEDGDSPLFLDSPKKGSSTTAPTAPGSPTPIVHTKRTQLLSAQPATDLDDAVPAATMTMTIPDSDIMFAEGPANMPIDFSAMNLPPSSPPSSFPSSSPSVSPRFTLDSVMDGMEDDDDVEALPLGGDEEEDGKMEDAEEERHRPEEGSALFSLSSDSMMATSATGESASSSTLPTSDANLELDWTVLEDMLGIRNNAPGQDHLMKSGPAQQPGHQDTSGMLEFLNALGLESGGGSSGESGMGMTMAGSDIFDFAAFNIGAYEQGNGTEKAVGEMMMVDGMTAPAAYDEGFTSFVNSFGG